MESPRGQDVGEVKFQTVYPGSGNGESIPFPPGSTDRLSNEVTFWRVQTQGLFLEPPKKA